MYISLSSGIKLSINILKVLKNWVQKKKRNRKKKEQIPVSIKFTGLSVLRQLRSAATDPATVSWTLLLNARIIILYLLHSLTDIPAVFLKSRSFLHTS